MKRDVKERQFQETNCIRVYQGAEIELLPLGGVHMVVKQGQQQLMSREHLYVGIMVLIEVGGDGVNLEDHSSVCLLVSDLRSFS